MSDYKHVCGEKSTVTCTFCVRNGKTDRRRRTLADAKAELVELAEHYAVRRYLVVKNIIDRLTE